MAEHPLLATAAEVPTYGLGPEFMSDINPTAVQNISQGVTDLCVAWMKPAVRPPLTAWGAGIKLLYCQVLALHLRSHKGMAPRGSNVGDDNVRDMAEKAEAEFKAMGRAKELPEGVVDSSSSTSNGLLLQPSSEPSRGW